MAEPVPVPPEHEHDWRDLGKRWAVCAVRGCAKAQVTLKAEIISYDDERDRKKVVTVTLDGAIEEEYEVIYRG